MTDPALLTARGIDKAFFGVKVLDGVDFTLHPGEIHALLGENGAGKSTLVKMIYGLVRPDAGTMTLGGQPYAPADPRAARAAGPDGPARARRRARPDVAPSASAARFR